MSENTATPAAPTAFEVSFDGSAPLAGPAAVGLGATVTFTATGRVIRTGVREPYVPGDVVTATSHVRILGVEGVSTDLEPVAPVDVAEAPPVAAPFLAPVVTAGRRGFRAPEFWLGALTGGGVVGLVPLLVELVSR